MIELAVDAAAARVHREINRTTVGYPAERSVKELFESTAARRPRSVAVAQGGRRLTYQELNQYANGLAARLRRNGVAPGDVVGVCLRRSPELIVSLLAVLKCGAAYLPFDESWPDQRLSGLFTDARCVVLLSDRPAELADRFPANLVVPVLVGQLTAEPADPDLTVAPDAIAYINFTSGSTGHPKGVPIEHRAITRLVFGARYARLDEHTTLLQLAPVTFDAATFEIWGALLPGGTCALYPRGFVRLSELRRTLTEHGVTVLFLTTALFNTVVDEAPETIAGVPTVLTGGEAHSLRHIRRALAIYGPDKLVSVYGPTECTTFATYYPIRSVAADETALPIGRPIQNTRAYLVDGDRLCAPGEIGEVLLGGPGLSPGYLGLPEITRERFADYHVDGRQERLYRTGDRAYLRPDGELVFQGRVDNQVKINGHRIELGEVSHHLGQHPLVRQNYVTVGELATGERALVAFVVTDDPACTPAAVLEFLRGRLPGYLIPALVRLCAALPLSPTGKVDREALLADTLSGTGGGR